MIYIFITFSVKEISSTYRSNLLNILLNTKIIDKFSTLFFIILVIDDYFLHSTTGSNGRSADLLQDERETPTPGRFKIEFRVNDYFRQNAINSMYPLIDVMFDVQNSREHYHIPLLLSPFGFTTYRGS